VRDGSVADVESMESKPACRVTHLALFFPPLVLRPSALRLRLEEGRVRVGVLLQDENISNTRLVRLSERHPSAMVLTLDRISKSTANTAASRSR